MALGHSATMASVMWREEHLRDVTVLKRVRISSLSFLSYYLIRTWLNTCFRVQWPTAIILNQETTEQILCYTWSWSCPAQNLSHLRSATLIWSILGTHKINSVCKEFMTPTFHVLASKNQLYNSLIHSCAQFPLVLRMTRLNLSYSPVESQRCHVYSSETLFCILQRVK